MAAATHTAEADAAGCPRCAYDMAGHLATWSDRCPLESECPECGLVFSWRDVLVEDRRRVPWLFEHARRGWWGTGLVRSAAAMPPRMTVPWIFWKRVGLHHRVVPVRLALWAALITLGLHAAGSVLAMLVTYAVLANYGLRGAQPWALSRIVNAWTRPLVEYTEGWSRAAWRWGLWPPYRLEWPSAAVAAALTWLAMVLVIPQTRARAKVHRRHLLRAATYSFAWVGLFELARLIETMWAAIFAFTGGRPPVLELTHTLLRAPGAILLIAWSAAWWHAVLGRGWRIPHPTRVWAVLLIPALLAAAVAWCAAYVTAAGGW